MYEQSLYKVLKDHIKPKVLKRMNRYSKWEYGYNKEYDIIVISKTGKIGEVYEIQNLKIALPAENKIHKFETNTWEHTEYPKVFVRREEGFWFYNKNVATYVTGTHYMYLQWSKIDVGQPDFRESNRLFYIFWEACKADHRSYGMCYLKNRRSGFSFMASGECVNMATISSDSRFGILSKSGPDAKKMFTNQFRTEWTVQRQNLRTGYPQQSTRVKSLRQTNNYKRSMGSTPRSTGRIQATTRTTVRSSNSSSTMRAANGNVRRTSSITGGSRKPAYD